MTSSLDDLLPGQGEIGTSVSEIEKIGEKVLLSLKEQPPTENAYEIDDFWGTPAILAQPNVTYGEVIKLPGATDSTASRRGFRRVILNEVGENVGEWMKTGFFLPNKDTGGGYHDKAGYFIEEVVLNDKKRKEAVTVGLRKSDGRVYLIKREISNHDPQSTDVNRFNCIEDQELHYDYDDEGNLLEIELYNLEPIKGINEPQKRIRNQRVVFVSNIAIKNRDERRRAIFHAEDAALHPPKPAPPAEPKKRRGIFNRLFHG